MMKMMILKVILIEVYSHLMTPAKKKKIMELAYLEDEFFLFSSK